MNRRPRHLPVRQTILLDFCPIEFLAHIFRVLAYSRSYPSADKADAEFQLGGSPSRVGEGGGFCPSGLDIGNDGLRQDQHATETILINTRLFSRPQNPLKKVINVMLKRQWVGSDRNNHF